MQTIPIERIHQDVYHFLRKNYPDLVFSLRRTNQNDRLSKGYWLLGTDNDVRITFWNATDNQNKSQSIYFAIETNGRCHLNLSASDGEDKAKKLSDVAELLDITRESKPNFWRKYYKENPNYLETIEEFLKDKKRIDIALRGSENLFPAIKSTIFNQNVLKIEELITSKKDNLLDIIPSVSIIKQWRLHAMSITNITHFQSQNLDLSANITCFVGENGRGKTTILRAVLLGIIGVDALNLSERAIQNLLRIENATSDKNKKFAERATIRLVNKCRNGIESEEVNEIDIINKYPKMHELNNISIENAENFTIMGARNDVYKQLIIGFSQQSRFDTTKNYADLIDYPNFEDVKSLLYDELDTRFSRFLFWLQSAMDPNIDGLERQKMMPVIEQIFEVIGEVTGNSISLIYESGTSEVKVTTFEHPEGLPLRLISQGYNNVIGWVGFFMKRLWESAPETQKLDFKNVAATCLIDEIDTYLHPKWQCTVLATLAKHFPNTQFIVTTHSPLVITHLPNENDTVKIYKVLNNNEIVPFVAAGRDIRSMLLEWFDVNERPDFAQKEINAFYELLEQDAPNISELRTKLEYLRQKYTEHDPDVLKIEQILNVLED